MAHILCGPRTWFLTTFIDPLYQEKSFEVFTLGGGGHAISRHMLVEYFLPMLAIQKLVLGGF